MKILALDSATECATIAILDNEKLLGEITINFKKQHSVIMMPMIDSLLKTCGLSIQDIDGYALSKGPGSFTGLRIGMSTIKGLVQSTNKPFAAISSLHGLANNLFGFNGIICPIVDALRGNVYTNFYRFNNTSLEVLDKDQLLSFEEVIKKCSAFNEQVIFIGDGTIKFKEKIKESLPTALIAPPQLNIARASSIGHLGYLKLSRGYSDNVLSCSPIYLRKCQAEREYEARVKSNE